MQPWEIVLFSMIVFFAIFIVCREVVCWYWKLNTIVNTLKQIAVDIAAMRKGG